MLDWMKLLQCTVAHQASDVFFDAGKPACKKLDGHITGETALYFADNPTQLQRQMISYFVCPLPIIKSGALLKLLHKTIFTYSHLSFFPV